MVADAPAYYVKQILNNAVTKVDTVDDTASGIAGFSFSAAQLAAAVRAIIMCHTEAVVLTWDGTTPTVVLGLELVAGEHYVLLGNRFINALKLVEGVASTAAISITLEY